MHSLTSRFAILFFFLVLAVSWPSRTAAQSSPSMILWSNVPVNQHVPITQAAFFPGGFELLTTAGTLIVVPFDYNRRNIFTMKFSITAGGTAYFKNNGRFPVLFLPADGYLVNGLMTDLRWYPFPSSFRPTRPVFLGFAPDFGGFLGMGWYPGMFLYGGFWSFTPWSPGQHFPATPGQVIIIGGMQFTDWADFLKYGQSHPTNWTFDNYWKTHPAQPPTIVQGSPGQNGPVLYGGPSFPGSGYPTFYGGPPTASGTILYGGNPRPGGGQMMRPYPILRQNPRPGGSQRTPLRPIIRRR